MISRLVTAIRQAVERRANEFDKPMARALIMSASLMSEDMSMFIPIQKVSTLGDLGAVVFVLAILSRRRTDKLALCVCL